MYSLKSSRCGVVIFDNRQLPDAVAQLPLARFPHEPSDRPVTLDNHNLLAGFQLGN